jgi:hydrogenase/urease accessory protein HupE
MRRAILILLVCTSEALAHPDHGGRGWLSAQLSHLLSEPDHLAMILAPLVVGLAWIARRAGKTRAMRRKSPPASR